MNARREFEYYDVVNYLIVANIFEELTLVGYRCGHG